VNCFLVRRSIAAVFVLVLLAGALRAENWPQWRGPNNDGISTEKGLPAEWSETKNVAWKLKMPGQGGSTPAVWGDRIFLTSQEGDKLVALCVSTAGKELWRKEMGAATRPAMRGEGNGASASPSTDGKLVWFFVGNGDFAAFDFTGKEVWRFNAQERYGKFQIQFGMHTTPVLFKDRLYFQLIHSGGRRDRERRQIAGLVVCIDKATGNDVWKVERMSDGYRENEHSYASAFVWTNGKKAYLVCHGNDYTTAHSLDDGKELWRLTGLNPKTRYNSTLRFVASPVCTPDLIVVPSAKRGPVVGLKPDAEGLVNPGSKFEQWRMKSGTPDVPCPLVHDGLVYLCGEYGGVTCLDAKTGTQFYKRETHNHRHRASPVYADGKVYTTARDGTVTVMQADREGKVLAVNKLPDQTASSPAISGGRIYLRGFDSLWAIEEKK
jgi:outer membrane protein assembly factor BamB